MIFLTSYSNELSKFDTESQLHRQKQVQNCKCNSSPLRNALHKHGRLQYYNLDRKQYKDTLLNRFE